MTDFTPLIESLNARYTIYRERYDAAKEEGDYAQAIILEASLSELSWCISEVQSMAVKQGGFKTEKGMLDKCQTKKYKDRAVNWKWVIENDMKYVEWMMDNGYVVFDEDTHNYICELQGRETYDDLKYEN